MGSLLAGGTREVELTTRIPVHMTYFTAMVDREGNLRTFGDLYGVDTRMGAALLGKKVPFVTPRYDAEIMAMRAQAEAERASGAPGLSSLADAISNGTERTPCPSHIPDQAPSAIPRGSPPATLRASKCARGTC